MNLTVAILGCFLGIYLGDLGLYALGRWVSHVLSADNKRFSPALDRYGRWFEQNAKVAIIASRFMPGTRLPLYLAAGMSGRGLAVFALWTCIAAALWTPIVVTLAYWAGDVVHDYLSFSGLWSVVVAVLLAFVAIRLLASLATSNGRHQWWMRIKRWRRYEFWPAWLFYLPLIPWVCCVNNPLSQFWVITAANACMPPGGFCG